MLHLDLCSVRIAFTLSAGPRHVSARGLTQPYVTPHTDKSAFLWFANSTSRPRNNM